jgi:4-oxalocrotonate tautomerase
MASPSIGSNTLPTSSTKDGDGMPHVIVKLWPGKSEQQKRRLARAIADDVMEVLHYGDESVSVAFEEVDANDWGPKVYEPDIARKADTLYKKPGYTMEKTTRQE